MNMVAASRRGATEACGAHNPELGVRLSPPLPPSWSVRPRRLEEE